MNDREQYWQERMKRQPAHIDEATDYGETDPAKIEQLGNFFASRFLKTAGKSKRSESKSITSSIPSSTAGVNQPSTVAQKQFEEAVAVILSAKSYVDWEFLIKASAKHFHPTKTIDEVLELYPTVASLTSTLFPENEKISPQSKAGLEQIVQRWLDGRKSA